MENQHLFEVSATIIKCEYSGERDCTTVILDQTIFFPQSGGQPCDQGSINEFTVSHVFYHASNADEVCHVISGQLNLSEGEEVILKVDSSLRKLNSRLHTAAHVIAGEVQLLNSLLQYKKCNLGQMYLMFAHVNLDKLELSDLPKDALQQRCSVVVSSNIRVSETVSDSGERQVSIGDSNVFRCSGTHVSLAEVGPITITQIKKKREKIDDAKRDCLKVTFTLA